MNPVNFMTKVCFWLIVLSSVGVVEAQKKKSVKKDLRRAEIIEQNPVKIHEIKDFAFVVEIDKNANVSVRVQKTEGSEFLADASSNKNLADFFAAVAPAAQNSKSATKPAAAFDPIIIVKADDSLDFGQVVEVVKRLRVSAEQKIKVQISDNRFAAVSAMTSENDNVKPNPSFLLAYLAKDSKIYLNRENHGSFQNLMPLREKLAEIFKDRERFGIFRPGTAEVESTVFVMAANSVKFGDVKRLAQAVAEAGASPIGLQLDTDIFYNPPDRMQK